MREFDFISVKLCICLIPGIVIGHYFNLPPVPCGATLLLLLLSTAWAMRRQGQGAFPHFGVLAACSTLCLGMFVVSLSNPLHFNTHYSNYLLDGKQWQVKVANVLKPTTFSHRVVTKVRYVGDTPASGKLLVNVPLGTPMTLKVDDELLFYGTPAAVRLPLNPHQFDYKTYLERKGITHQIRLQPDALLKNNTPSTTVFGLAQNFREGLIKKLKLYDFGEGELGVAQALILGKRDDISAATYSDYKDAGAVHILAVSGLHVGILMLLLSNLLKPLEALPKGASIKVWTVIFLLWAFAFVSGLSASTLRAVMMFSFFAHGVNVNRPTNRYNIIALSLCTILLVWPMLLFEVGFQLSYAAVLAIAWIYPKLQRFWYPDNWFLSKGWQLLSVSIAAQLGVLPLSLFYFHQFPALFFVSNLVVVPFLGFILGTGVLVTVLAALDALPSFLVHAYGFVIHGMNTVVGWVARQEGFIFRDIPFDGIQLVLAYLFILSGTLWLSKPRFKPLVLALTSAIGLSSWGIYQQWQVARKERLVLVHETKNSMLLHQKGAELHLLARNLESLGRTTNAYSIAERIQEITHDTLKNSYEYKGKHIFIMDSTAVYPPKKYMDYLLLTQSPKVNMQRLLDSVMPKYVLADGSNYNSDVIRWAASCQNRNIPFYYTGDGGAYVFE